MKCGTQFFKVMFPNQIAISKEEIDKLQTKLKEAHIEGDYISKRKELYRETMKFYIFEKCKELLEEYFYSVFFSSNINEFY